ncbi:hypothetical protein Q2T41_06380 [Maribacter confluentis]|uniref:DUF3298 domain-containing protein n=1 Tax=Maribacter confluentis TaxID=1656093 RepID=A0ABT8RPJ1_9FLAO|nr:hypothetical protein [Maribacter confluentis]MDO1512279.1 hypothetical protein [Maribacter confluentis]
MKHIKKLVVVVIVAVGFFSFKGIHQHHQMEHQVNELFADTIAAVEQEMSTYIQPELTDLNELTVLEDEQAVVLGFEVYNYLPIGFDAYAGANLTEADFQVFEQEEPVELGFNTAAYLPKDFSAHAL